jgi:hypothetical protein
MVMPKVRDLLRVLTNNDEAGQEVSEPAGAALGACDVGAMLTAMIATGQTQWGALATLAEAGLGCEAAEYVLAWKAEEPIRAVRGLAQLAKHMADGELPGLVAVAQAQGVGAMAIACGNVLSATTARYGNVEPGQSAIDLAVRLGVPKGQRDMIRATGVLAPPRGDGDNVGAIPDDCGFIAMPVGIGSQTRITLPKDALIVGGNLAFYAPVEFQSPMPKTLKVLGHCKFDQCWPPDGLSEQTLITGDLEIFCCQDFNGLPAGIEIGGNLILGGAAVWDGRLPKDAVIKGRIITTDHPRGILPSRWKPKLARGPV